MAAAESAGPTPGSLDGFLRDVFNWDGLVLLDTSFIIHDPYYNGGLRASTPRELWQEASRVENVTRVLQSNDNWAITPGVLKELCVGEEMSLKLGRRESDPMKRFALLDVHNARKALVNTINNSPGSVCLFSNGNEELQHRLVRRVRPVFLGYHKNPKNPQPDLDYIASALVFGKEIPVRIASHDEPINSTFAYVALNFGLEVSRAEIIYEDTKEFCSPQQYLERHEVVHWKPIPSI